MANIHDTLHPVTSPSDNLYPNINPVVNIPDESIPKRKMAFPIDSNGVTALIPTGAYVDIADLGIPGQVRFPSGTRYVYVQGGDVIVTPDLGEDKIYGFGVTSEWKFEIIVYSKNSDSYIAKRFNVGDDPVASVEDDDFVVLILMLSPVETGPQVIPIYSIIPFEFIKYNTQPYEKLLAQTMGIATIDGSYADLGAGKDSDGNVIASTYAKTTGSYAELGAGKDGDGNQISTTYAKQTGSYPTLGAGYLAKRYDLRTDGAQQGWLKIGTVPFSTVARWYEYSCIMLVHGIFRGSSTDPEGKAPKTALIEIEGRRYLNSLGNTRIGVLMGDVPKENLCFVIEENLDMSIYIYNDHVERITTTFEILSEGESLGSTVISPANIFQWNSNFVTALPSAPEGAVYAVNRNMAAYDGNGNVIASTYAKVGELSNETQLRTAADQAIMALIDDIEDGTTIVAKSETANTATTAETANTATKASQDGEGNVISETYAKKTDVPTATRLYQHNVTIKNGDDAIITTSVLTSTSDVFSSVDDLITILGNAGLSVSSGPKLLPACGTVVTMVGDTSVVYPVVGVGKYGNRVDGIGFYYIRSDVSVGRTGYQVLKNSNITYFNDTITQL